MVPIIKSINRLQYNFRIKNLKSTLINELEQIDNLVLRKYVKDIIELDYNDFLSLNLDLEGSFKRRDSYNLLEGFYLIKKKIKRYPRNLLI